MPHSSPSKSTPHTASLHPPSSPLARISIAIADADLPLARIVRSMLLHLGFTQVHIARDGASCLDVLQREGADIIITDWPMTPMDGLELLRHLRQSPDSPNRFIPVIMLTARPERRDVEAARDAGVTEYVLRPFTAKSLFRRIVQVVEHPRGFVIGPEYVGPERRHCKGPPPGMEDRRKAKLQLVSQNSAAPGGPIGETRLLAPDFAIKEKMGAGNSITKLVTPQMLEDSQAEIKSAEGESLKWLRDDVYLLEKLCASLRSEPDAPDIAQKLSDCALSVKSRAELFGYSRGGDVAASLYRFWRDWHNPHDPNHLLIAEKHITALSVIFNTDIKGDGGLPGYELMHNLQVLVSKFKQSGGTVAG